MHQIVSPDAQIQVQPQETFHGIRRENGMARESENTRENGLTRENGISRVNGILS